MSRITHGSATTAVMIHLVCFRQSFSRMEMSPNGVKKKSRRPMTTGFDFQSFFVWVADISVPSPAIGLMSRTV